MQQRVCEMLSIRFLSKLHPATQVKDTGNQRKPGTDASKSDFARTMAIESANDNRSNYQLLSRALGQGVTVAQVVDFDVFDEVTVRDVGLSGRAIAIAGRVGSHSRAIGL